eukprot:5326980-Alexandrium_andersonii.AAC.1
MSASLVGSEMCIRDRDECGVVRMRCVVDVSLLALLEALRVPVRRAKRPWWAEWPSGGMGPHNMNQG